MAKRKPAGFQWKKMPTPFHGKEYRVWGDVDGKRKQFWFATEKEAKAVCADRNQEQAAYGSKVNLDAEARLEAFRAAQLLEGSGKSIKKTSWDSSVGYYAELPGTKSNTCARLESPSPTPTDPCKRFHFRGESFYRPTGSLTSYSICEFRSNSPRQQIREKQAFRPDLTKRKKS